MVTLSVKGVELRHILVLEEYGPTRQALAQTLRRAGWHVVLVQAAHEARAILQQHTYDVLLVDIHGPTADVWRALTALRQLGNSTPLVLLVHTESVYRERVGSLVPCVLLAKPLSGQALLHGVAMALQQG